MPPLFDLLKDSAEELFKTIEELRRRLQPVLHPGEYVKAKADEYPRAPMRGLDLALRVAIADLRATIDAIDL